MGRHVGRVVAATAVVAATGAGTVLFGAGTATAAAPLIAGSCDTSMSGKPGQPVSVNTSSLLGDSGTTVALGAVPAKGSTTLSVPTASLMKGDGLLGLGKTVNSLTKAIGPTCDVTVRSLAAVNKPVEKVTKPVRDAAEPVTRPINRAIKPVTRDVNKTVAGLLPASPGTPPGTPPPKDGGSGPGPGAPPPSDVPGDGPGTRSPGTSPGPGGGFESGFPGGLGSRLPFDQIPAFGALGNGFGQTLSPSALYGNLPFVTSGMFQRQGNGFGNQVPGFSPQFGMLGQGGPGQGGPTVQNAGEAQALGSGAPGQDVGLPILVAVLALSGVTATLVRTWVLRRATA